MMKKLLFTTLMILPLFVQAADAVSTTEIPVEDASGNKIPLDKCTAANYLNCETIPEHQEPSVTDAVAIDAAWGQALITSKSRGTMTEGALNVDVQVSVICKGSTAKQIVIPNMSICSYPIVSAGKPDLEALAFTVVHDPKLNLKEDGNNLVLQYNDAGGTVPMNGICRADVTPKAAANPCKGPSAPKPQAAPKKVRGLPSFPGHN